MKKILATLGAGILAASLTFAGAATATANEGVCPALDTGHLEPTSESQSWNAVAPEGSLIAGYCVKAGSIKQGLGPESFTLDSPVSSLILAHSSGKDISHYALTFVAEPTQEPTPELELITEPIAAPYAVDECGFEFDRHAVDLPYFDRLPYSFDFVDSRVSGVGDVTYTATPVIGYRFAEGVRTVWVLTFDEAKCAVPPVVVPPEPRIFSDWVVQTVPNCDLADIVWEREAYVHEFDAVSESWVKVSTKTETQYRPLTVDEIATLDCPVDVPATPEAPLTPDLGVETVATTAPVLARTGSGDNTMVLGGALLALLAGVGLVAARQLRKQ